VRVAHCFNPQAAELLVDHIRANYPNADIEILSTTALCSFYAEEGGLMIGFEDAGAQ
jgi:fatty acid-binding protein DegV